MRRPNIAEANGSVRHDDDSNSVSSFSSRTSSLYVDPVKWNESDHVKSTVVKTNIVSLSDKKHSIGRGRNLASAANQSDIKRNPKGVLINPTDNPVRKPLGRGTLLKTVEKYHYKKDK